MSFYSHTSNSFSVVCTLHHFPMGSGMTSHSSDVRSNMRTKVDLPAAETHKSVLNAYLIKSQLKCLIMSSLHEMLKACY